MSLNILDYKFYLFLIISYLGLLIGIIISTFSKEELKKGKFYFKIVKSILFGLITCIFFSKIINIYLSALIGFLISLLSYLFERKNYTNKDFLYYSFFAIVLFESMKSELVIISTILIFLFSLIVSSILVEDFSELKFLQKLKVILPLYIHYIIIGFILSLIF